MASHRRSKDLAQDISTWKLAQASASKKLALVSPLSEPKHVSARFARLTYVK